MTIECIVSNFTTVKEEMFLHFSLFSSPSVFLTLPSPSSPSHSFPLFFPSPLFPSLHLFSFPLWYFLLLSFSFPIAAACSLISLSISFNILMFQWFTRRQQKSVVRERNINKVLDCQIGCPGRQEDIENLPRTNRGRVKLILEFKERSNQRSGVLWQSQPLREQRTQRNSSKEVFMQMICILFLERQFALSLRGFSWTFNPLFIG